jgi:hypothetical protein
VTIGFTVMARLVDALVKPYRPKNLNRTHSFVRGVSGMRTVPSDPVRVDAIIVQVDDPAGRVLT